MIMSKSCIYFCYRMMQKQLAYMLGRQQIFLELSDDVEENDELMEIMSNAHLNNNFLALAREVIFVITLYWFNTDV